MKVYDVVVARSGGMESHAIRTAKGAKDFGKFLGLPKKNIGSLIIGAMFHDNGKKYVPKEVLNKPGKLMASEFEIIKSHVTLNRVRCEDKDALDIVMQHHERVDGSGYPLGLQGNQINYLAKVFALVDVYDALTSDRVYRKAFPFNVALDIMRGMVGVNFDADLFDKFEEFIRENN